MFQNNDQNPSRNWREINMDLTGKINIWRSEVMVLLVIVGKQTCLDMCLCVYVLVCVRDGDGDEMR